MPLTTWEGCCVYYNVCPESVVTPFSAFLWSTWKRANGTNNCSYQEYWDLPAIYVDACEVIESEIAMCQKRTKEEMVTKDLLKRK